MRRLLSYQSTTKHRRDAQRELITSAEVVSDPQGSSFQSFVVVACFEMQPPAVGLKRGLRIVMAIGHDVGVDRGGEGPIGRRLSRWNRNGCGNGFPGATGLGQ